MGPAALRRPRAESRRQEREHGAQGLRQGTPAVSDALLAALALMLIIEGLLPTLHPGLWRRLFEQALQLSDGQLRFMGMASVLAGLALWHLLF
ncbi:MAG: hypothetical protein RIR43_1782 [Pseudomonadota bacterium]